VTGNEGFFAAIRNRRANRVLPIPPGDDRQVAADTVKVYVDETLWTECVDFASSIWLARRPGFWEYVELTYIEKGGRVEESPL
jgi:hypothetical protein